MVAATSTGWPGRPTSANDPNPRCARPPLTSLDGLTAIVAGAGPGIGRACAAALRREGADVVVAARDLARLEAMAFEMDAIGPSNTHVVPLAFDFADLASCRALVDETMERLGRIDILVNVATAGGETNSVADGE